MSLQPGPDDRDDSSSLIPGQADEPGPSSAAVPPPPAPPADHPGQAAPTTGPAVPPGYGATLPPSNYPSAPPPGGYYAPRPGAYGAPAGGQAAAPPPPAPWASHSQGSPSYPPAGGHQAAPPPGSPGAYGYGAFPGYPGAPQGAGYGQQYPRTDNKAVVALVLAISSWVICPLFSAVVALVLAGQSDRAIDASGGTLEGRSMNTATRWISWINIAFTVLALVALVLFVAWAATTDSSFVIDEGTRF